jgi:hypothetical protein
MHVTFQHNDILSGADSFGVSQCYIWSNKLMLSPRDSCFEICLYPFYNLPYLSFSKFCTLYSTPSPCGEAEIKIAFTLSLHPKYSGHICGPVMQYFTKYL